PSRPKCRVLSRASSKAWTSCFSARASSVRPRFVGTGRRHRPRSRSPPYRRSNVAGPGTLIGGVVAVGVGEAASTALDPVLEPQYWASITELFFNRLDPAIIATAIQRGIMRAPFALPYDVDVPVGHVTPFPVSPLDAEAEARAHGIDVERLRVETALVGLPMA